jgi:hypothetical protein
MRSLRFPEKGEKLLVELANPTDRDVKVELWWSNAPQLSPQLAELELKAGEKRSLSFKKNGWSPGEYCVCPLLHLKVKVGNWSYSEKYPYYSAAFNCTKLLASYFRGKEREFYSAAKVGDFYVMAGWDEERFYIKLKSSGSKRTAKPILYVEGRKILPQNTATSFLQGVLYRGERGTHSFAIKWSYLKTAPLFGKNIELKILHGGKKKGEHELTVILWDQREG